MNSLYLIRSWLDLKNKTTFQMPRNRMIKLSFWSDTTIGLQLSRDARLFYIGLWNFADDLGFVTAEIPILKKEIFPYDDLLHSDIQRMLDELSAAGRVINIQFRNKTYLYIPTFLNHQRIDRPNLKETYVPPSYKSLIDNALNLAPANMIDLNILVQSYIANQINSTNTQTQLVSNSTNTPTENNNNSSNTNPENTPSHVQTDLQNNDSTNYPPKEKEKINNKGEEEKEIEEKKISLSTRARDFQADDFGFDTRTPKKFIESEFSDVKFFISEFNKNKSAYLSGFANIDLNYYHDALRNWSEKNNVRHVEWLPWAEKFILGDIKNNSLKTTDTHGTNNKRNSPKNIATGKLIPPGGSFFD
jgi:hypothetical protein